MAGERLSQAELTRAGLVGDRVVQVYDRRGRIVTARTFPRLLQLRATLGSDGEPLVDGLPWNSPDVARRVEAAVAPGARLERFDGPERFDILPLLVCTDGAVTMFGRDVRRLRPNLVISGVAAAAERRWTGAMLRLPQADIALADLRGRCVMTTYDPDTAEQDPVCCATSSAVSAGACVSTRMSFALASSRREMLSTYECPWTTSGTLSDAQHHLELVEVSNESETVRYGGRRCVFQRR